MPLLVVERAEPEGVHVKVTKSGRGRRVPVADRILPIVQELAQAQSSDLLLFVTQSGHQLHASAVKRTIGWTTLSQGRRIYDLRHTAACLWLARGVDLAKVQSWMGHASIATTNIYLHHMGQEPTRRDSTASTAGGTHEALAGLRAPNHKHESTPPFLRFRW